MRRMGSAFEGNRKPWASWTSHCRSHCKVPGLNVQSFAHSMRLPVGTSFGDCGAKGTNVIAETSEERRKAYPFLQVQ
jgi:hypothetical protein